MTCSDYQDQLQRWLDGAADVSAFADHIGGCPVCRELEQAARRLRVGLGSMPALAVPAGFTDRSVGRVLADRQARIQVRRRFGMLAMAASVLLALTAGYVWLRQHTAAEPEVVQLTPPGHLLAASTPSLRDSVVEAGTAVVNLTKRTADDTVEPTRFLWSFSLPFPNLGDAGLLGKSLDPPTRSLREAGQSVSLGLQPVTSSAKRALDLFLRELPPMTGDGKTGS